MSKTQKLKKEKERVYILKNKQKKKKEEEKKWEFIYSYSLKNIKSQEALILTQDTSMILHGYGNTTNLEKLEYEN